MKKIFSASDIEYFSFINRHRKEIREARKNNSPCLNPLCQNHNKAIFSHIIQQGGILNDISEEGEVMMFSRQSLFEKGEPRYEKCGTSKVFGFYGFCNDCDRELFKSIEITPTISTWFQIESQYLLGLRTVLYTLQQTENLRLLYQMLDENYSDKLYSDHFWYIDKKMEMCNFVRAALEKGAYSSNYSEIIFSTYIIPYKIEVAAATTVMFAYPYYFGPKENREFYIIDLFPFNSNTIVIFGHHKNAATPWQDSMKTLLLNDGIEDNYHAIYQIMMYSDCHCVSPKFYRGWKSQNPTHFNTFLEAVQKYNVIL